MKNLFTNWQVLLFLCTVAFVAACDNDDDNNNQPIPTTAFGVFVINEGAFGSGNSSVSFFDYNTGIMYNNLFESSNGYPLGDVAQSMISKENTGYIVVNNSQKVEVVNLSTMKVKATITGFQGPRYMVITGGKGFVSDWFSDKVFVVNLAANTSVNQISVGTGPDQMTVAANKLFVCNVGGWGSDSTVTVIDPVTESVITTIPTGVNPNSAVVDINGKVWILCGGSTGPDFTGGTPDDIAGGLYCIDPVSLTVEKTIPIQSSIHPTKMTINPAGDKLWYLAGNDGYYGKPARMNITDSVFQVNPQINRSFYGLGIDPETGIIYGGNAPSFTQNGYMLRYLSTGNLLDSVQTGIAPNGFCFK